MWRYQQFITTALALGIVGFLVGCSTMGKTTNASTQTIGLVNAANKPRTSHIIPANPSLLHKRASFRVLNGTGQLQIEEYQSNTGAETLPSGIANVLYKKDGSWHTVYRTKRLQGRFVDPMWFHHGDIYYAVIAEHVRPGDWSGETMQIVQLTPSKGSWTANVDVNRSLSHPFRQGALYRYKTDLLVQEANVVGSSQLPVVYTFDKTGVRTHRVSSNFPATVPKSKVCNLDVKLDKTSNSVQVSTSVKSITLKVGQMLAVRETGDTYPIMVHAATKAGYDTSTSFLQERISPYRKAVLFKAVRPFHGFLTFAVHFAGPNFVKQTGVRLIPLTIR